MLSAPHSPGLAWTVLGLAAAGWTTSTLAVAAAPVVVQEPAQSAINRSVDKGVEWLLSRQELDGSWNYGTGPRVGNTALILYTLLKSGVDRRHQAVQRAVLHLESEDTQQTYDTSLLIPDESCA